MSADERSSRLGALLKKRVVLVPWLLLTLLEVSLFLAGYAVWEAWLALKVRLWRRQDDQARLAETRFYRLDRVAQASYRRGDLAQTEKQAKELLHLAVGRGKSWNYGNAIHHGHRLLGLVALKRGDREQAKQHLLASANTPGSPQLDSFGPNLSLAKALLELGERAVVLEYLMLCRFFWRMAGPRLDQWSATVKDGRIPSFGSNLFY